MTATEKEVLNTLFDTTYSWAAGYPVETCAGKPAPNFTDDAANSASTQSTNASALSANTDNATTLPQTGVSLQSIAGKIAQCTRCSLCQTRTNVVPGVGVTNPLVLVLGEAPGYYEDKQGEPFVGEAGKLLDKMLAAINLSRAENCFIANILKCRPPQNRDPYPEEADACRSFLDAQIAVLHPKMILCMGRIAIQNLLHITDGITKIHGKFLEYKGIPVMATFHPSALLREQQLKYTAWDDLKLFRAKLIEITNQGTN